MAKCLYLLCMQHWRCLPAVYASGRGWMDLKRNFQSTDKCHVRVMCRPESALRLSQMNRKQRTSCMYWWVRDSTHFIVMLRDIWVLRVPTFNSPILYGNVLRIYKFSKWQWICVRDTVAVASAEFDHHDPTGSAILANAKIQSMSKCEFIKKTHFTDLSRPPLEICHPLSHLSLSPCTISI